MLIGVGESVLTPTSMSMLGDRFPADKMGFASGFYYMGVPIGVGLSLLFAGFFGETYGWRACFIGLGIFGIVLALIMLFVKETPRKHLKEGVTSAKPDFKKIAVTLFVALKSSPTLLLVISGGIASHFILGAAVFDQLWLVEERGFERSFIAKTTGYVGIVGGILGNLFGGLGSDWFLKKFKMTRPMFLFWVMLVLCPINFLYRIVPGDTFIFWVGVFAGYFQLGCFYGPTFSTVQEMVPSQIRATIVAFYILGLNLIGLGIGITLGGLSIDLVRDSGIENPYTVILIAFTVLSMTAIPCFYFAGKRYNRDMEAIQKVQL